MTGEAISRVVLTRHRLGFEMMVVAVTGKQMETHSGHDTTRAPSTLKGVRSRHPNLNKRAGIHLKLYIKISIFSYYLFQIAKCSIKLTVIT